MVKNPELERLTEGWRLQQQRARKLPEFKLLNQRRYKTPTGYESYENVAQALAGQILTGYEVGWHLIKEDFVATHSIVIAEEVAQLQPPVYWLSSSLFQAFLHTDIPKWIGDIKRAIPLGILMLPINTIFTPDGDCVSFIVFKHVLANEPQPPIQFGKETVLLKSKPDDGLMWVSITKSGAMYTSVVGLEKNSDGELELNTGNDYFQNCERPGLELDTESERKFLASVSKILIQTLLVMQMRPEIVTASKLDSLTGMGFSNSKQPIPASSLWTPNWIGKNYAPPSSRLRSMPSESKNHTSPRAHWRRGHMRRVPIGKRELNLREWKWIEPILVNAPEML